MNKTPIVRTVLKRKFRLYLALAVILAFTILGYLMIDGNDFFGGLLTEVVGMCLTVFILDFIIATNEERRNYKIGRLAMLQIRSQLTRLFELLREQYKAVNNSALAPTYSIDLFTEENAAAICSRLDPDAVCPVIYERPKTWEVHNALFIEAFKNNLDLIVDKYLLYLPEDLVEAIEKLKGSATFEFYRVSRSLRAKLKEMNQPDRYMHGSENFYMEMFENFSSVESLLVTNGVGLAD